MTKTDFDKTPFGLRLALAAGASALALTTATAVAQEDPEDDVEVIEEEEEEASTTDQIVVTGSRIRRSTFNSISPLQVIGADTSREAGLIDAASILQNSTAATGTQIDATFQGFVTDNGPGSTTIDLRALGADRTLVLISGRRVGPAGVEGAPRAPDIGLIPSSLVEQYDLLLDGASSIYGSDAIAGVVNAVLRKDFEGLELEAFGALPQYDNGADYTISGSYGINNDRGFLGIGGEYRQRDAVVLGDRPWTNGCDRNYEITSDGDIRSLDIGLQRTLLDDYGITSPISPCKIGRRIGNVDFIPDASTTYFTPGTTNLGIPNLSDTLVFGVPIDADGDGVLDVNPLDFATYRLDNQEQFLFPDFKNYSALAYGEYTLEGEANITPYFEAMYSGREVTQRSRQGQFFPVVPAGNPFNPCGTEAFAAGFDCALALGQLFSNPNYREAFLQTYGTVPEAFGRPRIAGPTALRPVVAIGGDRNETYSKVEQYRLVGGVRGDMPFMNVGTLAGWNFDLWGSYNRSEGVAERTGIRGDRVNFALGAFSDPDANGTLTPCVNDTDTELSADVTAGCVPVNFFAESLYRVSGSRGDFATQAERDYLFDVRDFDTTYEQSIVNGFVNGTVFTVPAGDVSLGVGFEYRRDELDSQPDNIAGEGLFFGFFSDLGAEASSDIWSVFAETEVPLLGGKPFVEELTVNASGRFTSVELENPDRNVTQEDDAFTYSLKVGYRPVSSLLLRATYGTSFRAPNLGEFGLRGTTGFVTLFDPCAVPEGLIDPLTGQPTGNPDPRDPQTIAACQREGVDPFTLGLDANGNTNQFFSTEVQSGAGIDLESETSRSYTVGFSWEQPFFDSFDLTLGVTHYDIEIEDTIVAPGAQFVINDCFANDNAARSVFCDRITRDANGVFDIIDLGFINRDLETSAGVDYNLLFRKDLTVFGRPMDFAYDIRANNTTERNFTFVDDNGNVLADDLDGQFGVPEWNGVGTALLEVGDYRFTWQTRFIDAVTQDQDGVDDFGNVFGEVDLNGDGVITPDVEDGFFADTCIGTFRGGVDCRDFAEADEYYLHTASMYYRGDSWTIGGGVRNVFNTRPPQVDTSEVTGFNNTPIGVGYDLNGRTFFLNVAKQF